MTTTPNNLRHHRERVGLRQIDIAHLLGLQSSDRISHWELGVAMPSVVNLFKLATLFRVPPHELYAELFKAFEEDAGRAGANKEIRFGQTIRQEQQSAGRC